MNVKCQKCGMEINNCKFCPYCGTKAQSDELLIIGIVLMIMFPLVGIIFCLLESFNEPRLKKVLMWYGITILVVAVIIVALLSFVFSGLFGVIV